jgi:hypothetical protein
MLKGALRKTAQSTELHDVFGLMQKFHNIPYANQAAKPASLRAASPVP